MIGTLTRAVKDTASWTLTTPLRVAFTHGNQALVTLASAYMNAQFAQSHNILDPWIAWALAVGYEWTYLRGLASAERTRSTWTVALNGVALLTAIIGGMLYCVDRYGALPARPDQTVALLLSAAHVLPMALLSLCSAMVYRAASAGDVASLEARRAAALELEAERLRKEQDLELWERGQRIKADLDAEKKRRNADARAASKPMRRDAENKTGIVPLSKGKLATCRQCHKQVAWGTPSEAGTIKRWGCTECRSERNTKG